MIWNSTCLGEQLWPEMNANVPVLFVSKYFKSGCPSLFNSNSALAHTLRGQTLSRCVGMLHSGLWTSCVSSPTSRLSPLHSYNNIQGLWHSEFRLIWPDVVTLSHNFQTGNHSVLKKSDTLCSEQPWDSGSILRESKRNPFVWRKQILQSRCACHKRVPSLRGISTILRYGSCGWQVWN